MSTVTERHAAVVVLDFDGVICDSIDECMVTAFTAYEEMQGGPASPVSAQRLDPELAAAFRRMRYLVRPAREYWVLVHHLLTTGFRGDDLRQPEFDDLARRHRHTLAAYEPVFFAARGRMQHDKPETWLALHRQYPQADGLRELCRRHSVHVATTKDKNSVERLADAWSLPIDPRRLWTHESGLSKPDSIQRIAASENRDPENLHFVDDHPSHLREVASTGATCYWASWGYTPQADSLTAAVRLNSLSQLSRILEA